MKIGKVILVNPPVWDIRSPPINVAYLRAFVHHCGYPVKAFDFNAELFDRVPAEQRRYWTSDFHDYWQNEQRWTEQLKPDLGPALFDHMVDSILAEQPDVVGFTMNYSPHLIGDLALALKAADPRIVTVAGGNYCEPFIFGGMLLHRGAFDFVALGEGEVTLLEILVRLETGRCGDDIPSTFVLRDGEYIENPRRDRILDFENLPWPDFDDFDLSLYWEPDHSERSTRLPLLFARGCFCNCDFCMQNVIWAKPYVQRSGDALFAEVQRNVQRYGVREFQFADLAINGDLRKLGRFCDLVIESGLDIAWGGGANIRKGMDRAFLRRIKAAGCEWLDHGLESGSDAVLRSMGKPYDAAMAAAYIRDVFEVGINPQFSLIVGHPAEGPEEFRETLDFLRGVGPYIGDVTPSVTVCGIYPRTPLQAKLADFGGDPETDLWMDWTLGDNTFAERRRRVGVLHDFLRRYVGHGGIKIDDDEVFEYLDAAVDEGVDGEQGAPQRGEEGKERDDVDQDQDGGPAGGDDLGAGVPGGLEGERRRRRRGGRRHDRGGRRRGGRRRHGR